jgi:hypothetical protein
MGRVRCARVPSARARRASSKLRRWPSLSRTGRRVWNVRYLNDWVPVSVHRG